MECACYCADFALLRYVLNCVPVVVVLNDTHDSLPPPEQLRLVTTCVHVHSGLLQTVADMSEPRHSVQHNLTYLPFLRACASVCARRIWAQCVCNCSHPVPNCCLRVQRALISQPRAASVSPCRCWFVGWSLEAERSRLLLLLLLGGVPSSNNSALEGQTH